MFLQSPLGRFASVSKINVNSADSISVCECAALEEHQASDPDPGALDAISGKPDKHIGDVSDCF